MQVTATGMEASTPTRLNMLRRPTLITRLVPKATLAVGAAHIRQSPTLAMHGLRWLATTTPATTRITRTCLSSAMVMCPRTSWQMQTRQVRCMSTMPEDELKKRMDAFQDLFVEARLCIEDAQESQETTYFAEDLDAAQEAVDEAVAAFESVVNDIEDKDQKNSVLRSNGLKVEQLKGELQMIIDGHGHHH